MRTMQRVLSSAALVLGSACAQAQALAPVQPMADLRAALRQGAAAGKGAQPRQLSPEERAELRRQLSQQALRPKGH